MSTFSVTVSRTETRNKLFEVYAHTAEEAHDKAIKAAANFDYGDVTVSTVEYAVECSMDTTPPVKEYNVELVRVTRDSALISVRATSEEEAAEKAVIKAKAAGDSVWLAEEPEFEILDMDCEETDD